MLNVSIALALNRRNDPQHSKQQNTITMKNIAQRTYGTQITGMLLTSITDLPAAVVVDHFNSPVGGQGVSISNGIVGTYQDDVRTGLTVLGGSREIIFQLQSIFDAANYCSVNVNGGTSSDELSLANGSNVESQCTLVWDANSIGLNTNLSLDYAFNMLNVHNDIPVAYTISMQTFGGGISIQTVSTGTNYIGDLTFPFGGFSSGADLTDIDRISLTIDGGRSVDVSMDALITVPETGSAVLAVLGCMGLLVRRRRS